METPPFMKSWVDLASTSNPSTPPHPLQREQHPLAAASQELATSSSVFPSTSGEGGVSASGVTSDIPPALPHLTGSSNMTTAMTSSGFLSRTNELPILSTSSPICGEGAVASSSSSSGLHRLSFGEDSDKVGPLCFGYSDETFRLLKEAQRESKDSSARVSLSSSRRASPPGSPKSPPNSPNIIQDPSSMRGAQLENYEGACYINYFSQNEDNYVRVERRPDTDWIWDWSSRPDQKPPKEWRFSHPASTASGSSAASHTADAEDSKLLHPSASSILLKRHGASLRHVRIGKSALFSKEVLYTILLTNVLSLILGTGIGVWLSRKSGPPSFTTIATLPFM